MRGSPIGPEERAEEVEPEEREEHDREVEREAVQVLEEEKLRLAVVPVSAALADRATRAGSIAKERCSRLYGSSSR